jgi:hypothetical protein
MMSIANQLSNLETTEDGTMVLVPTELMDSLRSSISKSTGRKAKKTADPLKPKRPMNPYMRWLKENRSTIKESLPEDANGPTHVSKAAGEQWRSEVGEDAKKPFEEAYEADKVRYAEEMESYAPQPAATEDYDDSDIAEAPPNWNGPELWMYLKKCVRDKDGKVIKFQDFDEAVEAANKIEECGGITKTSTGYSLRVGPCPRPNDVGSRSGMASWVKSTSQHTIYDADTEDELSSPTKNTIPVETEEPVAKKETKKSFKKKEPEPEPESEDEELDVEEVELDGKKYYKDEKGIVYDKESGDEVGAFVDGEYVAN